MPLTIRCPQGVIAPFLLAILITVLGALQAAASTVTVKTSAGREITGEVDSRSDSHAFWIRVVEEKILMAMAFAWDDIHSVQVDGETLTAEQFRPLVQHLQTAETNELFLRAAANRKSERVAELIDVPSTGITRHKELRHSQLPRVESLEFHAAFQNWDRDVEPDGVELYIIPLDAHRRLVPINGNISINLDGYRAGRRREEKGFSNLQRWSRAVVAADFTSDGARFRLPFRQIEPQFDVAISPYALLNVHLNAYGYGNFEASETVSVRYFEPLRDSLQQNEGYRYFSNELTARPRR